MSIPGERWLNRWSRLKQQNQPADPPPPLAPESQLPEVQAVPESALDPAPVDSLDKDSDFTPFLADGVPQELARAALRKLWRSDPVLANLDGLNDYDEDYTIAGQLLNVAEAVMDGDSEAEVVAEEDVALAEPSAEGAKVVDGPPDDIPEEPLVEVAKPHNSKG